MDDDANLPVTVPTVMDDPADFTVVASSPKEMERGQKSLILWAARKIQHEKELLKEAQEQFDIARKNKWGSGGWQRRISLSEGKIEYYRKIKMALEAGYYIVPPFPISVFAIRTEAGKPTTRHGFWDFQEARKHGIEAKALPAEQGKYVSNLTKPQAYKTTQEVPYSEPKRWESRTAYRPAAFCDVEFPFKLAKAAVMSETAKAMALKVFDQIGIMGQKPEAVAAAIPDPIVCGQIMPWFHKRQPVTFFIAWWLDTKSL